MTSSFNPDSLNADQLANLITVATAAMEKKQAEAAAKAAQEAEQRKREAEEAEQRRRVEAEQRQREAEQAEQRRQVEAELATRCLNQEQTNVAATQQGGTEEVKHVRKRKIEEYQESDHPSVSLITSCAWLTCLICSCIHCNKRGLICRRPKDHKKGRACLRCADAKIKCVWPDVPQSPHHKRVKPDSRPEAPEPPQARPAHNLEGPRKLDVQEVDSESTAIPTKKGCVHHSPSEVHSLLNSGVSWSVHEEAMDDRELLIRTLSELQEFRRLVAVEQDKRAALTLKMAELQEVVIQVIQGRQDAGVAQERADALTDYFQDLLDEMADESDAEFTEGEFESGSEDEDTDSDDQGREPRH